MKTETNKRPRRFSLSLILLIIFVLAFICWAVPLPKLKSQSSYIYNYVTFANNYLKQAGLKTSHVDDASGFSSKSVSTAQDLTSLGLTFIDNQVLRDIATQSSAELPVAGTVHNTNWLVNTNGVV